MMSPGRCGRRSGSGSSASALSYQLRARSSWNRISASNCGVSRALRMSAAGTSKGLSSSIGREMRFFLGRPPAASGGVARVGEVRGRHVEALELVHRQVDAVLARVLAHVADDVGELEGDAEVARVLEGPRATSASP